MIKFSVNGKIFELENDINVYELKFIALERDGESLPKKLWRERFMSEGKAYEIVTLVGGG